MRLLLDITRVPVGHRVELKTVDPEIVLQWHEVPRSMGQGLSVNLVLGPQIIAALNEGTS
jgi:hypothetical protein